MEISICEPKPETRTRMIELLNKAHSEYSITYKVYMANHLPHAFGTIYSLGGTTEHLETYMNHYIKRLEPLQKPKFTVDESNWKSYMGAHTDYAELLEFFDKEVARLGIQGCVDKYVHRLIPGLHVSALHPLIHIGYALEYDLPQVMAEGLAYATTDYQAAGELIDSLPETGNGEPAGSSSLLEIFEGLKSVSVVPNRVGRIDINILLTEGKEQVQALLAKWTLCETDQDAALDELSKMTIMACFGSFRANGRLDFFLAHGVTGVHGVRAVLPFLTVPDRTRLLRNFLLAFLGSYWVEGMPEIKEEYFYEYEGPTDNIDWPTIIEQALVCPDEHVAKVVRSILVMKERVPDSVISHKLLDHVAYTMVNHIKGVEAFEVEYNFHGMRALEVAE